MSQYLKLIDGVEVKINNGVGSVLSCTPNTIAIEITTMSSSTKKLILTKHSDPEATTISEFTFEANPVLQTDDFDIIAPLGAMLSLTAILEIGCSYTLRLRIPTVDSKHIVYTLQLPISSIVRDITSTVYMCYNHDLISNGQRSHYVPRLAFTSRVHEQIRDVLIPKDENDETDYELYITDGIRKTQRISGIPYDLQTAYLSDYIHPTTKFLDVYLDQFDYRIKKMFEHNKQMRIDYHESGHNPETVLPLTNEIFNLLVAEIPWLMYTSITLANGTCINLASYNNCSILGVMAYDYYESYKHCATRIIRRALSETCANYSHRLESTRFVEHLKFVHEFGREIIKIIDSFNNDRVEVVTSPPPSPSRTIEESDEVIIKAAAVIVVDKHGNVLIGKEPKSDKVKSELYTLPVGKLEGNEIPLDAAVRELREETGLIVDSNHLIRVHMWPDTVEKVNSLPGNGALDAHIYKSTTGKTYATFVYVTKLENCESAGSTKAGDMLQDQKFLPISEIASLYDNFEGRYCLTYVNSLVIDSDNAADSANVSRWFSLINSLEMNDLVSILSLTSPQPSFTNGPSHFDKHQGAVFTKEEMDECDRAIAEEQSNLLTLEQVEESGFGDEYGKHEDGTPVTLKDILATRGVDIVDGKFVDQGEVKLQTNVKTPVSNRLASKLAAVEEFLEPNDEKKGRRVVECRAPVDVYVEPKDGFGGLRSGEHFTTKVNGYHPEEHDLSYAEATKLFASCDSEVEKLKNLIVAPDIKPVEAEAFSTPIPSKASSVREVKLSKSPFLQQPDSYLETTNAIGNTWTCSSVTKTAEEYLISSYDKVSHGGKADLKAAIVSGRVIANERIIQNPYAFMSRDLHEAVWYGGKDDHPLDMRFRHGQTLLSLSANRFGKGLQYNGRMAFRFKPLQDGSSLNLLFDKALTEAHQHPGSAHKHGAHILTTYDVEVALPQLGMVFDVDGIFRSKDATSKSSLEMISKTSQFGVEFNTPVSARPDFGVGNAFAYAFIIKYVQTVLSTTCSVRSEARGFTSYNGDEQFEQWASLVRFNFVKKFSKSTVKEDIVMSYCIEVERTSSENTVTGPDDTVNWCKYIIVPKQFRPFA